MRWIWIAGSMVVIGAGITWWQYQSFIHAPLRPSGPEARAELQAEIESQDESAFEQPDQTPFVARKTNPTRNVYFGDLHIHTSVSFDSYLFGNRLDPDTAYRIAKGEKAEITPGEPVELTTPLDFAALTDHAEGFGLHVACGTLEQNEAGERFCGSLQEPSIAFFLQLRNSGEGRPMKRETSIFQNDPEVARQSARETWANIKEIADRHNEPGRFTTFAGYEYSPVLKDTGKHHRNIIFRSSVSPIDAVSAYDAPSEIDLWKELEATCQGECKFLTIPHNPNRSWGLAFASETIDGVPYTSNDWALRARSEPLVEMFQIKGNSECSAAFGAGDEECNFEQFFPPCENDGDTLCISSTSMIRDGLKKGLALEQSTGVNPMQFGVIGATDTHNANPGDTEEWDYRGASAFVSSPARRRLEGGRGGNRISVQRNPGGLAAVWAEENTRDALFDAMKRKEVYATSGTRLSLRFFAGFDMNETRVSDVTLEQLYAKGVPMGGELLSEAGTAPNFFISAARDPNSAPLAKVQVIKGWLEDGVEKEKVFDVACGNETHGGENTCLIPTDSVNLADCSWNAEAGVSSIRTWWQDPEYDERQSAFYYARVVQNPTCRWSTYDSLRLGLTPPDDVPATVKEMAWSSPIWIKPR
ncbi:MAG: DUF3604 domain-containing protein [Pseudomonadales bacterium]|nr:DUF3604 domain-containing protein [Pseudomonadales bacterium]MBO6594647.1 DUF3604 domain-containing protein [Pseudomonadales bacterium]MBO6821793.1 DUF3604 domain-containing protein [Pseudomonadales bacterium]